MRVSDLTGKVVITPQIELKKKKFNIEITEIRQVGVKQTLVASLKMNACAKFG